MNNLYNIILCIRNIAYGVSFFKWTCSEYISERGIRTVELNKNHLTQVTRSYELCELTWSGFRIFIICTFKSYCNRSNEASDSGDNHGLSTALQKLSIFSLFQILMTELMTFRIFWQKRMEPTFNTIFNTIETFR